MILMNQLNLVEFPHVKRVGVSIFIACCKVKRLLRIPADSRALIHQNSLLECTFSSDVVQVDASVHRCAGYYIGLNWIELYFCDCIDPLK